MTDLDQHDRPDHDDHGHGPHDTTIGTTVMFAFSTKPPFKADYNPTDTVGTVRGDAMRYFAVDEDPAHVCYLSFERVRQDDTTTLGDLDEHRQHLTFRLVKELVQGAA